MIAVEVVIYIIAAMAVPSKVAIGIVRRGFTTESAGTVAVSTPINVQIVKAAT